MLGVSGHVHKHWGSTYTLTAMAARLIALTMMVVAIFIAGYATFMFAKRASLLKCAPSLVRTLQRLALPPVALHAVALLEDEYTCCRSGNGTYAVHPFVSESDGILTCKTGSLLQHNSETQLAPAGSSKMWDTKTNCFQWSLLSPWQWSSRPFSQAL